MPHVLTSWIHGPDPGFPGVSPKDYVKIWWDPTDPSDVIFGDYWLAARVHFLHDSGCWRMQVFTSPGARHIMFPSLTDPDVLPLEALERADSILELYALYAREYRKTFGFKAQYFFALDRRKSSSRLHNPHAPLHSPLRLHPSYRHRRYEPPWVPELRTRYDHRILRWSSVLDLGPDIEERYIRPVVHSPATLVNLPYSRQQGLLVERVNPGALPAATVELRQGRWTWRVHLNAYLPGGGDESGSASTPQDAFLQAERMLRSLGAVEAPPYSPDLQPGLSPVAPQGSNQGHP